ncbi:Hypothetical protein LUCI_4500 [Lucifera butyrica]|uniref:Isochorismatase-like domain-containing protein n=1 Tax=Lucifera butyrica TaxID=1351585 RepID=A0A498RGI8_9FIRM|nr:isochorismatase family cysteine hydrolase [Lucifera butyrica]VBB09213.1 Hypothetical protein LUCI_4500 [Lucifera butyrica]
MNLRDKGFLFIKWLTIFLLAIWWLSGCSNITASKSNYQKALLVIDVQEDSTGKILKPPFLYQSGSDLFISKINKIIEAANNDGVLVVYTRMNSKMEDTPGSKLDARLKKINDNIFLKDKLDAFSSSDGRFEKFITNQKNIKELYIIGLDATLCVNETARAAVRRGYKTTVLSDAITTISNKGINEIINDYKNSGILVTTSDQIWKL